MTPIERAARALCELDHNPPGAAMNGKPLWMDYLPEVRTVLAALREPTPDMVVAGDKAFRQSIRFDKAALAWRDMIDALLAENQ